MKTFESQLLELLREYEKYEETFSTMNKYDFDFPNFYQWLSKRVEKEVEKKNEITTTQQLEMHLFYAVNILNRLIVDDEKNRSKWQDFWEKVVTIRSNL
jgi:tRNA nucleotidyltransferase/poly(A) polymerase